MSLPVFGFTLLRNGVKYDYCFIEALKSLSAITSKIFIALGDNEDTTEESLQSFKNIEIKHTVWDESLKEGAIILSQQTNIALEMAREHAKGLDSAWGIYLQCDEVFHEEDYTLILEDLAKANSSGCDVMTFRYLHFWENHHSLAINKKWYPQEIRAVKLSNENIESWGDAQSFRNFNKVYESDARIYHYGHVREESKYRMKKEDILKLYHNDEKLPKYQKREKKFDELTEVISYWGNHPKVMKDRIERLGDIWSLPEVEKLFIIGNKEDFSKKFLSQIHAKEVVFVKSKKEIDSFEGNFKTIKFSPSLLDQFFSKSSVPKKMRSKIAKDWNFEFYFTLRLSEIGVGLKA